PGLDVQFTFLAIKGSTPHEVIVPPRPDGTPGQVGANFSPAIKVGNRLYVSGGTGTTDTNVGDMKAQTTEMLARLERSIKAAGFTFEDTATAERWITDIPNFAAMNEAYRPVFPTDAPARATVGSGALAGNGALVEMAL